MKIIIDGRLYSQTGVGRYLQKLIQNLALIDKKNQYVIFLTKNDFTAFKLSAKNFEKRLVNIKWHSLLEQLLLPVYLIKEQPDLVHFPYFSLPLLYPGKFVVTIHDLIIDHFDTGRASTHNFWFYKLKRLFYRLIINQAVHRAQKIIAVSLSTKKEIMDHYRIPASKIRVTYESTDLATDLKSAKKPLIPPPYLLYVGNAYPHKNLERLLEVLNILISQYPNISLVLVGAEDYFYQRLKKKVVEAKLQEKIIFFGFANDEKLVNLYHYAALFVFPSLMEGFGLPGLEAMKIGIPVVCSDIPVFREVYQEAALYFDPNRPLQMAEKIAELLKNKNLKNILVTAGQKQVAKYSWQKMACQTLEVYESCVRL